MTLPPSSCFISLFDLCHRCVVGAAAAAALAYAEYQKKKEGKKNDGDSAHRLTCLKPLDNAKN